MGELIPTLEAQEQRDQHILDLAMLDSLGDLQKAMQLARSRGLTPAGLRWFQRYIGARRLALEGLSKEVLERHRAEYTEMLRLLTIAARAADLEAKECAWQRFRECIVRHDPEIAVEESYPGNSRAADFAAGVVASAEVLKGALESLESNGVQQVN